MKNEEYRKIVDEYSDMVTRLCVIHTGNYHDGEDCYQNTFFKLYTTLEKQEIPNPKAWLIRVALNECNSLLRYRLRRNTVDFDEVTAVASDNYEVEMLDAVYHLSPKYRDVIYLYYYEQMTIEEIANISGRGVNTVKSQLKRGREKLKNYV